MNKINSWLNEESKLFSFLASEKITRKAGLTMHAITMLGFISVCNWLSCSLAEQI